MPFRTSISKWLTALVILVSMVSCSRGMIIAEYPMPNPDPSRLDARSDAQYWSAYARIENQDIPNLWKISDLDYAIISVEATIPTRKGQIRRTIPLFTIDRGAPQAESGVDLLKKLPLTKDAREQVTFKLKVMYLKDERALKVARNILGRVAKLAEPFLASYPLASQIIESSLGLISDSVETEERPVSSLVSVIVPEELYKNSNTEGNLQVFFFIPIDLRTNRRIPRDSSDESEAANAGGKCQLHDSVEQCGVKAWVATQLGLDAGKRLVECGDMPGRLCLVDGGQPEISAETIGAIERLISANSSSPPTQGNASAAKPLSRSEKSELAKYFDNAQNKLGVEDKIPLSRLPLHVQEMFAPQLRAVIKTREECANDAYFSPPCRDRDREDAQLESQLVRVTQLIQIDRSRRIPYTMNRLDSIVYVTIKLTPYTQVFDPLAMVPGADVMCQDIEQSSIESVRDYFTSNIDFFTEDDGDRIRLMLRFASDYVRARELLDRRLYSEVLRILVALERPRKEYRRGAGLGHNIERQTGALDRCLLEIEDVDPIRQYIMLWRLGHPSRDDYGTSHSEIERLDMIASLLRQIQLQTDGATVDLHAPSAGLAGPNGEFQFIVLLADEAREILAAQEQLAAGVPCDLDEETKTLFGLRDDDANDFPLSLFSDVCDTCFAAIEKRCKVGSAKILKYRERRRFDAGTKLRYLNWSY